MMFEKLLLDNGPLYVCIAFTYSAVPNCHVVTAIYLGEEFHPTRPYFKSYKLNESLKNVLKT